MAKDVPNQLPPGVDMLDMPAGYDQERLDEVLKIKAEANDKFKAADYFSAKCLYSGALEMLERCCLHLPKADETWESIKNNMALCDLKRKEWTRVIDTTTEILTRNPSNTKALYRRGVARIGTGKLQEAQRDLRLVIELEPDNAEARNRLVEVQQQTRQKKSMDRDQADKMRGFLRGERLDDTVAISEDGGVRKLHGNENAPLFSSWIKRAWLTPDSRTTAVVTVHVQLKTQAGKEVYSTRKAPSAASSQQVGPSMASQPRPALRPAEPARWVLDDSWGLVMKAWNTAVKSLQLHEMGRFEVAKHTLGPTVEGAIERCSAKWLADTPERLEVYRDVPQDVQAAAKRRQALQILGLPEELCMELVTDPNTTLNMEMELLEVSELHDLAGDGLQLLRVIREGKKRSDSVPVVTDLSTVVVHYRIAKLLQNFALKDTRMGLVNTGDGLAMREDKTKEPVEFVVGEEDACDKEGEYVPPCVGKCLLIPPQGVVEGMHFELILRDGVAISQLERSISAAYEGGYMSTLPDTSGPVVIKIEVESVAPPLSGPSTNAWQGIESLREERRRAEELQELDDGRHKRKALKRWRRIVAWLEQILEGRRWKLQGGLAAAGDSMYDLEWDDDEDGSSPAAGEAEKAAEPASTKGVVAKAGGAKELMPSLFEIEDELVRQLQPDELCEWASAHSACAQLLADHDASLCEKHARCAVQAAKLGQVPRDVEISGRSNLAAGLIESGSSEEALEVLKVAQELDPTNLLLRDQAALASQKDSDRKTVDMKERLRFMKEDISSALESGDRALVLEKLQTIDRMPLTWDAVHETAIGKEVGKCAKHDDPEIVDCAKAIIATLHKLAKQQRPMWTR